jgi:MGT family glycosyltransferase
MQSQKTIAMFLHGGFLAHVTRTFELARVLARDLGYRVVFCGDGPYMHIPKKAGFEVRPVYTVHRDTTMKLARRFGLCSLAWWRSVCARSVESDLEALDDLKPDLVVGDMHWSLGTAARIEGIPYVALTNAGWTRWFSVPFEPPQGHFLTKLLGKRWSRAVFPTFKNLVTRYYALGYSKVRQRHGLPPIRSIYDLIEGGVTLLADLPEFMPMMDDAPRSFRYVGPIVWDADLPEPRWLKKLDSKRPTLYFTMGSTGDTKFFREAIRLFGNTEYQILITTGGLADLGAVPSNVFVEEYAPGRALMRVSDAVISHGGNGTVYQALSCGVPVIGFPTIFDQEINMQRLTALGAGIRLWRSEYTADTFKRAIDEVVGNPSYRDRCQKLAGRIQQMDGPRRAALHIDHLVRSGNPELHPDDPCAEGGRPQAAAVGQGLIPTELQQRGVASRA